jgi:putative endonuclease
MVAFIYILQDIKKAYYIGSANHLQQRLKDHIKGYSKYTKTMDKPCLVFSQEYSTLSEARKIELKLKQLKRKDYIDRIINEGFIKMKP